MDAPAAKTPPSRAALYLAFGSVYILWGSTYLAIRIALESMPPLAMASARFLVAGGALYLFMRWRGAERPTLRHWRGTALVGFLLLGCGNGGVVLAERHTPSSLVALLIAGTPLWMTIFESLLKRTVPRPAVILGLLTGLAGVAILIGPGRIAGGEPIDTFGAVAVLCASLSWSFGSIYSRELSLPPSPFLATAMEMLAGGAALAIAALLTGEASAIRLDAITLRSFGGWAYLVAAGSLGGFTAFVYLLQHTSAAKVSTYAYVNPVIAVILGWLVAGEPLSPRTLVAGTVIIGALVLITKAKS